MLRSLRTRILLVIVLVAIGTAAAVGLLSRRVTLSEFDRYVGVNDADRLKRAQTMLGDYVYEDDKWAGLDALISRASDIEHVGVLAVDPSGVVVSAAPRDLAHATVVIEADNAIHLRESDGGMVRETVIKGPRPITIRKPNGEPALSFYVLPQPNAGPRADQQVFVGSVTRAMWIAALFVCGLAMVTALITSRRVLGPVEQLTSAAARLGAGDLSGRVEARGSDEIGDLGRAFNVMADSLATAEQTRRNMANDIAHELRTPLSNIRCQIEALQDGLAQPGRETIDSLHDEAMHLVSLVDDLQDLALAEANQLRLNPEPRSVRDDVNRAVQVIKAAQPSGGPAIHVDVKADVPMVMADPKRLRQMLSNLLSNAVRHTPLDGRIDVVARVTGRFVEISIRDTGPGIAPEHLAHVFDRFYRADESRERATGGVGLGLTIVRQLVRAHGGEVRVESVVGVGTTFVFTLPMA